MAASPSSPSAAGVPLPAKPLALGTPAPRRTQLLMQLGETLRQLRQQRGLSRLALAQQASLSPRFLAQLEAGQGNISVAKLADLARALDVPLGGLLGHPPAALPGPGQAPDAQAALLAQIQELLPRAAPDVLQDLLRRLRRGGQRGAAPRVIVLVGLRGAGKSTVGPLLAQDLGVRFVETDTVIQDASGLALAELFELHGEEYYRTAEQAALRRLVEAGQPVVVAASGGVVTDARTFQLLQAQTLLVWLKARPEQHMQRVLAQGDRRPMANRPNAMAELRALLRTRAPLYRQAQVVLDTSRRGPAECAQRLAAQVRQMWSEEEPPRRR